MAKKERKSGMWERDFEDISSHSRNAPPPKRPHPVQENRSFRSGEERRPARPTRPVRRPPPDWELPEWDLQNRRRSPERGRTSSERPRRPEPSGHRPPPAKRRGKKPVRPGVRKAMLTFTVLFMTVVTVLLAIFLLFKVSTIKITGDVIEKYGTDEILRVSGCKTGENLVFLPTGSREEALKEQLPYIGEVEFIRHFPGTLEIRVTAVKVAACVSSGGGWLYVNDSGKILENQKEPQNGILQILGLSPLDTEPGDHLRLEDSSAQDACDAILKTVAELEMTQEFTRVDISNLSDIRLLYQDRIELQLGNVLDLDYKIDLGCRSLEKLEKLEAGQKGVMDLSHAGETKNAVFTSGEIGAASAQTPAPPAQSGTQEPVSSSPEGTTDDPASQPEPSGNPRTEGIPDDVFTGGEE